MCLFLLMPNYIHARPGVAHLLTSAINRGTSQGEGHCHNAGFRLDYIALQMNTAINTVPTSDASFPRYRFRRLCQIRPKMTAVLGMPLCRSQ